MHEYMHDRGGPPAAWQGPVNSKETEYQGEENQPEKHAGIKSNCATLIPGHVHRNAGHVAGISGHVRRNTQYGAQSVYGACAEVAYWRHRFILDSAGLLDQVLLTEHSIFQGVLDGTSIDLMEQPWAQARAEWTHGSDYGATQAVAAEVQLRGVQWLGYASVRAPGERCAVAFDVNCLYEPKQSLDSTIQRWVCKATRSSVMFTRDRESYVWDF